MPQIGYGKAREGATLAHHLEENDPSTAGADDFTKKKATGIPGRL
jgi:hypothetical protein